MAAETPALRIAELHREHGERIRGYLARLVGTTDAEDLQQEVFEKAQRAIGAFRGDSRALTWLYRVATNVAIDRLRSAGRRAELQRDAPDADAIGGAGTSAEPTSVAAHQEPRESGLPADGVRIGRKLAGSAVRG